MNKLIITVLAKDRPGIIAKVTTDLFELKCNLENVNQMILQGQFAGFFIVEAPAEQTPEAVEAVLKEKTNGNGLTIHVHRLDTPETGNTEASFDPGEIFLITTIGPDQKGLVARFSSIIAAHNGNIVNLKAVFKGGVDPNDNVMSYQVAITKDVDATAMFEALREKAKELNLDIRIQHKNIFDVINKI
ncbi:MAG: ACT domain-containing protein [Desulfobacterales bacterium]|nr:ACT domain-containing protein [Desulfobacterales bacterium]